MNCETVQHFSTFGHMVSCEPLGYSKGATDENHINVGPCYKTGGQSVDWRPQKGNKFGRNPWLEKVEKYLTWNIQCGRRLCLIIVLW